MKRFAIFSIFIVFVLFVSGCKKDSNPVKDTTQMTQPPAGMVLVAGGTFTMGDTYSINSLPLHSVTLSSFYISKTEVTQG